MRTRTHVCFWPECDVPVPDTRCCCGAHWKALPEDIRRVVWLAHFGRLEKEPGAEERHKQAVELVHKWVLEQRPEIVARKPPTKRARKKAGE